MQQNCSLRDQHTKFSCPYIHQQWSNEIKKIILITRANKRIKHQGINLTKEVKDLYTENYKTLLKEIPYSWIGRYDTVQMAMLQSVSKF